MKKLEDWQLQQMFHCGGKGAYYKELSDLARESYPNYKTDVEGFLEYRDTVIKPLLDEKMYNLWYKVHRGRWFDERMSPEDFEYYLIKRYHPKSKWDYYQVRSRVKKFRKYTKDTKLNRIYHRLGLAQPSILDRELDPWWVWPMIIGVTILFFVLSWFAIWFFCDGGIFQLGAWIWVIGIALGCLF